MAYPSGIVLFHYESDPCEGCGWITERSDVRRLDALDCNCPTCGRRLRMPVKLERTTMSDDQIVRYVITVQDRISRFCASCRTNQLVWSGTTVGGEVLTCCTICSYVIQRERA
jgi:hypothetical protein